MNAAEKKVLLVGATGEIGGLAARQLAGYGAATALAGRDPERLRARGAALGGRPWRGFDAYDLDGCARLASWAGEALGGLDAVVVAVGVAAFGASADVSDASAEHLFAVNTLCPMAVVRGALPVLPRGGVVVAVTGEIVDRPLSAWPTTRRPRLRSPCGCA
ncbi:SDR family NAD(P)-dependent oxidoreductase [Streptomyces roseolus]|uniref:SDR family NAD(P)-dependent oxidoreductase n=1 Tax=Streptomyces roseolus TaxID=67358 RepID=UPI0034004AE1